MREKLIVGQSLIKKIINQGHEETSWCPLYLYKAEIKRSINRHVSLDMKYGIFGETLCIGSGAYESVYDLPRDKRTKEERKKTAQIQIEKHAKLFPKIAMEKGITVYIDVNTQVPLFYQWDEDTIFKGTMDIFPTPIMWNNNIEIAIIDVKFTKDVKTTWGNFCWGAPQFIDHLQADAYHWLVRVVDKDFQKEMNPDHDYDLILSDFVLHNRNNIKFIYWVMGHVNTENIREQILFLERRYQDKYGGDLRQMEAQERIKDGIKLLRKAEEHGWPARPSSDACKRCALARHNGGDCKVSTETII